MGHDNLATVIKSLAGTGKQDVALLASVLRAGSSLSCSAPGYGAPIEVLPSASLPKLYKGDQVVVIRASGVFVAVALAAGSAVGNRARRKAQTAS